MKIKYFCFHRTRNTDLNLNISLPVGLGYSEVTSNMKSFALMWCFAGSLTLYLDEMKELKCAVVGKMRPLM